MIVTLHSSGAR